MQPSFYIYEHPVCEGCNIMYAASKIHNGKCTRCRETTLFNRLVFAGLVVAVGLAILTSCSSRLQSLAESRCMKNGDWLENEYCNAAARDLENV